MAFSLDPKKCALIIQDLQNDVIMPGGAFTKSDGPRPPGACEEPEGRGQRKGDRGRRPRGGHAGDPRLVRRRQGRPRPEAERAALPGGGRRGPRAWVTGARRRLRPRAETRRPHRREDAHERLPGHEPRERSSRARSRERRHHRRLDELLDRAQARHAADAGYQAIVVTDATSTMNDEWQHAALDYALTNIAERVPTEDVVAALQRRGGETRRGEASGRPRPGGASPTLVKAVEWRRTRIRAGASARATQLTDRAVVRARASAGAHAAQVESDRRARGEAEFRVDGDRRLVRAEEAIVLPPHSRHGFTNVGDGLLHTLAVFAAANTRRVRGRARRRLHDLLATDEGSVREREDGPARRRFST